MAIPSRGAEKALCAAFLLFFMAIALGLTLALVTDDGRALTGAYLGQAAAAISIAWLMGLLAAWRLGTLAAGGEAWKRRPTGSRQLPRNSPTC